MWCKLGQIRCMQAAVEAAIEQGSSTLVQLADGSQVLLHPLFCMQCHRAATQARHGCAAVPCWCDGMDGCDAEQLL